VEKGMKNADVRLGNKRRLIKLLYWNNGISKQDISTVLRLSMPTVNLLVSHLEEDGLIEKRRADTSSGGRIPDLLFFKYNARLVVGVEIFQGECVILITDLQGTPQARKKIQARYNDGVTYWQGLRALILQLIEENSFRREDILGVGITMQNSIERYSKVAGALPTPGAFTRSENLGVALGFPTVIERDTNAAGFANVWFEKKLEQAIYLSISNEVSGSLITGRNILYGDNGRCGEFGHMTLVPDGVKCSCGRRGCVQAYCSTSVLTGAVNDNLSQFFALLPSSEALQKIWDSYSDRLGTLIANLNIALDLPVIIGGELGVYIEQFENGLTQKVKKANPFYAAKPIQAALVLENAAGIGVTLMISARYLNLMEND